MHFLDQAKIFLKSGAGGPGAVSFRREIYIEYGGPDGGNGGKGGDIVFEAVQGLNTLIDFRYAQHFKAKRGNHGQGKDRTGAGAPDLVVKVPLGTQVLSEDKEEVLADFTEVGQRLVFLEGGMGGRGNASYYDPDNRIPRPVTGIGNVRIVQISAGYQHCAAVAESRQLLLWGSNGSGQCGTGVRMVREAGLSLALFAPGWSLECGEAKQCEGDAEAARACDARFWQALGLPRRT